MEEGTAVQAVTYIGDELSVARTSSLDLPCYGNVLFLSSHTSR